MSRKIIFLTAPEWCPSCRVMHPVIKEAASLLGLALEIVDTDEDPATAANLGVSSLPTTILLGDNGVEITRITGAYPLSKTISKLEI